MINNQEYRSRGDGRIGVIVPMSNTNLEPDMMMLKPDGVSVHFARTGGYDLDKVPDSKQMGDFALSSIEPVVELLVAARPDVILYGCTSATLAHGPGFDHNFTAKIESLAGVPAVTAAGALVESLRAVGAKSIAFTSPYVEALNREAIEFLSACDIETVSSAYVGSDLGNYGQGELTPSEVYELGIRADSDAADALVLSCTDMRAVEVIDFLNKTLGKPVISSNQALMQSAISRLPG